MARQSGIIKIEGTIDGLNFYRSRGKHLVRESNPVSPERIATEPAFARTRENYAEFSTASRAGKLLRRALKQQMLNARDGRVANRLMGLMLKIAKTDPVSERGKRNTANGDLDLLRNFDFNNQTTLERSFKPPVEVNINRETGLASVTTAAFIPEQHLNYPAGATHYQLLFAGVELDFINGKSVTAAAETELLEINNNQMEPVTLQCQLTPNNESPQILALGIVFTQLVNGKEYPLKDKGFNALQVVKVSNPKNKTPIKQVITGNKNLTDNLAKTNKQQYGIGVYNNTVAASQTLLTTRKPITSKRPGISRQETIDLPPEPSATIIIPVHPP